MHMSASIQPTIRPRDSMMPRLNADASPRVATRRTRVTRESSSSFVASLSTLLVDRVVLEAALGSVPVDLGDQGLATALDQIDVGLLAALEAAETGIDDSVIDEHLERTHELARSGPSSPAAPHDEVVAASGVSWVS